MLGHLDATAILAERPLLTIEAAKTPQTIVTVGPMNRTDAF